MMKQNAGSHHWSIARFATENAKLCRIFRRRLYIGAAFETDSPFTSLIEVLSTCSDLWLGRQTRHWQVQSTSFLRVGSQVFVALTFLAF